MEAIAVAVIASGITGVISAVAASQLTIAGLRVQMTYLERSLEKHDAAIIRAHERIDEIAGKQA